MALTQKGLLDRRVESEIEAHLFVALNLQPGLEQTGFELLPHQSLLLLAQPRVLHVSDGGVGLRRLSFRLQSRQHLYVDASIGCDGKARLGASSLFVFVAEDVVHFPLAISKVKPGSQIDAGFLKKMHTKAVTCCNDISRSFRLCRVQQDWGNAVPMEGARHCPRRWPGLHWQHLGQGRTAIELMIQAWPSEWMKTHSFL